MLRPEDFLKKEKAKRLEEKWLPRLHHILMRKYGWIPYEEFKRLPLPMLWQLFEQIQLEDEEERKALEKIKSQTRLRR